MIHLKFRQLSEAAREFAVQDYIETLTEILSPDQDLLIELTSMYLLQLDTTYDGDGNVVETVIEPDTYNEEM